ncbi:glycosyltransferase family 2 protein [Sanguibacter antarcticus]|uniref:GT2 family glycosyltransferase n=1 Tax=Sanguibacter antarcticus TaxID=372484 RepID=A0A2A9E1S4_9MICO|nr:glycosyltransferase family 2 protein [Sanguibacter antarcticus]PFG32521.1 GT2 family glycosyltransferase [Sanguibacter antarcticus]
MTGPLVRAVVVNWNGAHLLRPCLDSLLAQDLGPGELHVLVVDNASTDGSLALLAESYPTVAVRSMPTNLGFAGGVSAGLADLDAPYAALLNNDATFAPDAVRLLVEHLEAPEHARVGAATARILLTEPDASGRTLVNSTGNVLTRTGGATDRDWERPAEETVAAVEVFGFCGGAALLRAATLTDVGSFDPTLFLYYEDTDLSWRMQAGGWSIHHVSTAVAHHEHAASSDASSPLFRYYNTRNSLLVYARHAPAGVTARSWARQTLALVRHTVARTEPTASLDARRRALRDFLRLLPATLRHRRDGWAGTSRQQRRAVYRAGLTTAP